MMPAQLTVQSAGSHPSRPPQLQDELDDRFSAFERGRVLRPPTATPKTVDAEALITPNPFAKGRPGNTAL